MSNKITKIISISLLALIIPVAIVVTAICLSSAVTYSLTIASEGLEDVGAISYKVNGKDYEEGMRLKKGADVTVSVTTKGYDFIGWYNGTAKNSDLGTEVISTERVYTFVIDKDTCLTAKNSIIEYSVSYDNEEAVRIKYGNTLKNTTTVTIPEGKYLAGWKVDVNKDGVLTGTELEQTATNLAEFTDKDVKLIASIEDIHYLVSYNGAEAVDVKYGAVIADGTGVEAPEGKYFVGWTVEGNAISVAKFDAKYMNGKEVVQIDPKFETIKYQVKYDGATAVEVSYGAELNTEIVIPEGKYFEGWELEGEIYTQAKFPATYVNASEVELTSSIKDIHYLVSYNGAEAVDVKYGDSLTAGADEDRENGVVFDSWSLNGVKVATAVFEGYKNGDTVVLNDVQKNLYESLDSYKNVTLKVTYQTTDGKNLSKTASTFEELSFVQKLYTNEVTEENQLKWNFSTLKVSEVYEDYKEVYIQNGVDKYQFFNVKVKTSNSEQAVGETDFENSTIANLIDIYENLVDEELNRLEPVVLNIVLIYEAA